MEDIQENHNLNVWIVSYTLMVIGCFVLAWFCYGWLTQTEMLTPSQSGELVMRGAALGGLIGSLSGGFAGLIVMYRRLI